MAALRSEVLCANLPVRWIIKLHGVEVCLALAWWMASLSTAAQAGGSVLHSITTSEAHSVVPFTKHKSPRQRFSRWIQTLESSYVTRWLKLFHHLT